MMTLRRSSSGTNLAASAGDGSSSGLAPSGAGKPKKSLANFLGTGSSGAAKNGRSGSATVAGDRNVTTSDDSEIYIRADGKKVRRVKRTVVRTKSGSGSTSGALGDMAAAAVAAAPPTTTTSGSNHNNTGSSRSLMGESQPASTPAATSASASHAGSDIISQTEEFYIRPDGKKVRRIKKTISKRNLSEEELAATKEPTPESAPSRKSLGGFLDRQTPAPGARKLSGSATVAGDRVTDRVTYEEGEIIIRADGKKVRRIKKTIVRTKSSELQGMAQTGGGDLSSSTHAPTASSSSSSPTNKQPMTAPASPTRATATTAPSSSLDAFVQSNSPKRNSKSGSATVAVSAPTTRGTSGGLQRSSSFEEGEIYINAKGQRVRRVRKAKGTAAATSGSSSDDGTSPSTAAAEGEIYIRPDGKKVRRVVKKSSASTSSVSPANDTPSPAATARSTPATPSSTSSSGGLAGFLAAESPRAVSRQSGSATVAGDRVTEEVGEVVIRADGKKVRRIKRTVVRTSSNHQLDPAPTSASKDDNDDNKTEPTMTAPAATTPSLKPPTPPPPPAATPPALKPAPVTPSAATPAKATPAAATAAAAVPPRKDSLGSFLDKNDGPRPTKSGSATVTGAPMKPEGEIYINAEGKRVRRVKKSALAAATAKVQQASAAPTPPAATPPASGRGDLAKMLDSPRSRKKSLSSATVAGDTPSKFKPQEGEIYIRADGKKVRRVKKSSLSVADEADGDQKPAAVTKTPAGERVLKVTDEGEIVIRADGRKVLRRKKKEPDNKSTDGEGEVYRRPDGKLVRRVKRSSAGDLAGFLDENKSTNKQRDGSATVFGDQISKRKDGGALSDLLTKPKPAPDRPTTPATAPMSDGSGHQKENAAVEESPPTVSQDLTTPKSALSMPSSSLPSASVSADPPSQLSEDDESIAQFYRKKLSMGMPADAVRHKMVQDGIEPHIIAAVMGDGGTAAPLQETSIPSLPAMATSASSATLSEDEEALAQFYCKKLKMGMPADAVRHKMVQDGVDERVISSVLGDTAPTSAVAPTASTSIVSSLTEDEEAVAQFYRKKLNMGMPLDAVRHKMIQDGVDPKVMAAVVGGDLPEASPSGESGASSAPSGVPLTEDEEALAQFYRKKLKMGMPVDAVRHKMIQDGVDAKIIAAVVGAEGPAGAAPVAPPSEPAAQKHSSDLSAEESFLVDSYLRMAKLGMPIDAVKHKMTQEGVDAKLILHVINEVGSAPAMQSTQLPPSLLPATNSVAYIVVVNEDDTPDSAPPGGVSHAPMSDSELDAIVHDEKFAVKVEENAETPSGTGETKFMTLEQIAKLTGQSKDELATMVATKRQKQEAVPRFVLQPLQRSESVYEVEVPAAPTGNAPTAPATGSNMKSVKEGQEVVDSALANAARAVSALGDGDMTKLLAKLQAGDIGELLSKLEEAEKRQKKLEKQLAQAGVAIAEDIEYGEAKTKVEQIAKRMNEIGGSDVVVADKDEQNRLREEYFKLEQEMERYNTALMLTEEYQAEQDRQEKKWETDNAPGNIEALKKIRRHMPVKIRHMSEADLTNNPSPNGKFLPKPIAKKFKRTNVLQLLRINPDDIERMHPSTLENMRVTGLTLTERRALYLHLKPVGPKWEKNKAEKMTERKWTWYTMMKNNFKENLAPFIRHCEQYGPPDNHVGCPLLGKQCPIKADLLVDYNNDYGYTDADEYEVSEVRKADVDDPGAKAMLEALELAREKKANERADLLKKHYKGKLLQVSKANGSCEAMDELMDKMENHTMKWLEFVILKGDNLSEDDEKKEVANFTDALNEIKLAVLDLAQRSGMQMTGKKKAGGDTEDPRSTVEAGLSEEVYECSCELFSFIQDRTKTHDIKDTRVEKTVELLDGMLKELHSRNVSTIEKLGGKRPDRSRKLKKIADLRKDVEEKLKPKEEEKAPEEEAPRPMGLPPGVGGRGDLMSALQGRGRGGGRGDLLSALAGRGRGGRGGRVGGDSGGRGGLLSAIQGRGAPGGSDGGRGGLMAAIQGRGAGRGGGDGGGRSGLMAAIAARGGG